MTPDQYKADIDHLKKEVEYWKALYHKVKDENEKLALDLGLRDYPQFKLPSQGD